MSEDRDAYYRRCMRLFERELCTMTGVNVHDYRAIDAPAPLVKITDLDEMNALLECFLPMRNQLVMASRETLIDGLKDVIQYQDKLCLFGANVDNDEHGYLIRPRALYASFGAVPENTCVALDNIPRPTDLLERKAEVGQTAYVTLGGRSYTFIDLQAGHNPLLIFPHGAVYGGSKKAIATAIDQLCEDDLQELPLYRKP